MICTKTLGATALSGRTGVTARAEGSIARPNTAAAMMRRAVLRKRPRVKPPDLVTKASPPRFGGAFGSR